jgi:hypothetical protein
MARALSRTYPFRLEIMAAKERKERKGLGKSRSACLRPTTITATQQGHSRRRDIGMSRYVAWHSNAVANASDQIYDFNFAFLKLLSKRFGGLPASLIKKIERMNYFQLEQLDDQVLDAKDVPQLTAWLKQQRIAK